MPPRLIFQPALASTTKVPLGHSCSASVAFKIYVTVYREWWNKFRNDGKRIEVWSDLPGGARQRGEWGETPFVEQSRSTPLQSGASTPTTDGQSFSFSLLSDVEQSSKNYAIPQAYNNERKVTLIATFALPQVYSHYSYTFRVSGPGGRVDWLGHMGSNGVVIVGEPGNRCGFEEQGNWSALGSSARKWDRDLQTDAADEPVAIGSFKNVDMVGWAFGRNGFNQKVTSTENTKGANLFVLHPRLDTSIASRPYTDPPASIVVSSPNETTSILADGTIVTTANSVTIQDFYPFGLPSEVQNATAQEWETLDSPIDGPGDSFVFIKSNPPEGGNSLFPASVPASVAILPAVSGDTLPATSVVQLPLPMVFQLQPQLQRSVLYSPENNSIEVVDFTSPDIQAKENLSLEVGRDGGELVVVPAFEIGKAIEEADKESEDIWTVGILEPAVTSVSIEASGRPSVEPITPTMEEQVVSLPDSEVEGPVEPELQAEEVQPKVDDGEVVALGSPAREPAPLAPEFATGSEEEVTMSEVKEGTASPSEPSTPAAYPPATSIVKINDKLVGASQHMWLGALKVVLTWLHVVVGLWAVFLLRLGGSTKEEAPVNTEVADESKTVAEDDAPTTDVPEVEEQPSDKPETISLDEVLVPAHPAPEPVEETAEPLAADDDDDDEEFKYPVDGPEPVEQPKFIASANKAILTPPMTPPHLTANLRASPLSAIGISPINSLSLDGTHETTSPTDEVVDEPNIRTKLVFQLPPNSLGKFKLVLNHHEAESETGLDRIRVTVDRKVVPWGHTESEIDARISQVADQQHSWLVDVDASRVLTRGKVEVSVA